MMPSAHPIIVSLPKSATIYFQRSFEQTLALKHYPITSGFDIDEEALRGLMDRPCGFGGDHLRATKSNLHSLAKAGIKRIAVMVRDPRDALVSLWHHLDREDIKSQPWLIGALAERGINPDYFRLAPEEQLAEQIEHTFPHYQRWLGEWAQALDAPSPFAFHLRRYEDFVQDPAGALRRAYRFFGYDAEPVLPNVRSEQGSVDTFTHYRRGVVGSHRDEVPANLISRLTALIDPGLFERFNWAL